MNVDNGRDSQLPFNSLLFRSFSFTVASRHPSSLRLGANSLDVSPTSSPIYFRRPHLDYKNIPELNTDMSIVQLSERLSQQEISEEIKINQGRKYSSFDSCGISSIDILPSSQAPHTPSASYIRAQSQLHTRLLTSSSHVKDIASLVEKMVDNKEQCHCRYEKEHAVLSAQNPTTYQENDPYFSKQEKRTSSHIYDPASVHHSRFTKGTNYGVMRSIRIRKRRLRSI